MFPAWRLKLREVQVAVADGRYEEAIALLEQQPLCEFRPARELAQEVSGKMVARASERFACGDTMAGWQDLTVAERLGGQGDAIARLREGYAAAALDEVRRFLAAGQPAVALTRIEKLERKRLLGQTGRTLAQIAVAMQQSQVAAQRGSFAEAAAANKRAIRLAADGRRGDGTMEIVEQLAAQGRLIDQGQQDAQQLTAELHERLVEQDWSAVLTAAEKLLAIAPQHAAARLARRRAWKAVGMDVTQAAHRVRGGNVSLAWNAAVPGLRHSTQRGVRSHEDDTVTGSESANRALLWVDAVGGFLVCLDDHIVLGQPSSGPTIGVPILADLSRRHALIRREAGAYVLEPVQAVWIDGRPVSGPTVLADGQLIQLGDNVQLRFTKPHALSATARLDFVSHHKTQPTADAVLLMADSCVMGTGAHCHIRCRDWQHDVVLYRDGESLQCRSPLPLLVDGELRTGPLPVLPGERIEGENFSFTWEMTA